MITPIRLSFDTACTPASAFAIWTDRISMWWPADHTATGRTDLTVVLEGHEGGRIFERTPDGEVHEWGEVTVWEPPRRLVYLWHLRRDRADATEVEIRFTASGQGRTRVDIEHRGWERLGTDAPAWRDRNHQGWSTLLPHYITACQAHRSGEGPDHRGEEA